MNAPKAHKMRIRQNVRRTALLRQFLLVEHIKFLELDAKSSYLAGFLSVISCFCEMPFRKIKALRV